MFKKFISNAMLSIVMDKQAKEKYHAVRESRKARKRAPKVSQDAEQADSQTPREGAPPLNREELIRNAQAVLKEKSKVLDNLTVNDRRKLQLLAMQAMKSKGNRPD